MILLLCNFRGTRDLLLATVRMVFVGMEARNPFSMNWQMDIEVLFSCIVGYPESSSNKQTLTTHRANVVSDVSNVSLQHAW